MTTRERSQSLFVPPDAPPREQCVTCGHPIDTPFCPTCGERRASDRKLGVLDFIRDYILEAIISFDGRVIRSVKALLLKPGKLTAEFMRGSRIPYVGPLQFFLMINVVYFVWAAKSHDRMFETQLSVQIDQPLYGPTARQLVRAKLRATGEVSDAAFKKYEEPFNRLESTQARSLLVAMAPIFAVIVAIVTIGRRRRPFVQHLVFALHSLCFLVVFSIVARYLVTDPLDWLLPKLHVPQGEYGYDEQYSYVMLAILTTYLALSVRRAYAFSRLRSWLSGAALAIGVFISLTVYRGLLFFVTYYSM